MRAKFVDWPRKHGTQLSPDPISTPPCPLDTGTVDGNGWRKLLCPKLFRQADPLSKAAGQWMPVGQWSSPTVVALTQQLCAGLLTPHLA